ncbi:MAG TPA: nucleoside-diphosphate kinase [Tenuifilaceae bacterium]|nr:nucleoside-diphosphate kinase [Tenuifilaceae bacterium]HPE17971.1 nucleoside-diphosphate kinase [Tenuifilaceae bacterium]HPJ44907.1 nucleoside-diphosphate kinase [Tenuifilaceae bacterium]HPQ33127.1 nucleoside-diphosphate kinase [Tenuifilaceae bacterium]HRX67059.1 nucleoside-diphosphate kinase [Tenuifilaceae bacterium]
MKGNRTFAMIKPDAIENNHMGEIFTQIVKAGFKIKAMKMTRLGTYEAKRFYYIHEGKEFFNRLIDFITSGPIIAMVLEKEKAVEGFRELIGNTNPEKAADGTIRKLYAESTTRNSVHGSDSDENALDEWSFFFSDREIEF